MTDELTLERCDEGTVVYSNYRPDEPVTTGVPLLTFGEYPPILRCPKCGRTDVTTHLIRFTGDKLGALVGDYCFVCFVEFIAQHVPKMEAL